MNTSISTFLHLPTKSIAYQFGLVHSEFGMVVIEIDLLFILELL
jgi:hypothetical protein